MIDDHGATHEASATARFPWPAGFVELRPDPQNARPPNLLEPRWALKLGGFLAFAGYLVALFGVARVNSLGLSALLPVFWLAVVLAHTRGRDTSRDARRVAVVRNAALALLGALSGCAVWTMLSHRLFSLGHDGDNPSVPIGAALSLAAVLCAPVAALVSLAVLRRGRRVTRRVLHGTLALSLLTLGALVAASCIRHARAPDLVSWLNDSHEALRVPSPTRAPARWTRSAPDEHGRRRDDIGRVLGLTIRVQCPVERRWCDGSITLDGSTDFVGESLVDFLQDGELVLGIDREAQLVIPPRGMWNAAYDYGHHRVVERARDIRRPLATVPEWTACGALGFLCALVILRRAARRPEGLDRTAWRQGTLRDDTREIVFDDGTSCSGALLPAACVGPVLVSTTGAAGSGYRDDRSATACTVLAGTFADVDRALGDARDLALVRTLAITWTAGAPLAASWLHGLL